jgi:hypothetical protein
MGNPIGVKVAGNGEAVMSRIVSEVAQAISEYRHGRGFVVPQQARLDVPRIYSGPLIRYFVIKENDHGT